MHLITMSWSVVIEKSARQQAKRRKSFDSIFQSCMLHVISRNKILNSSSGSNLEGTHPCAGSLLPGSTLFSAMDPGHVPDQT